MKVLVRFIVSAVSFVATFYFVFWVPLSLVLPRRVPSWAPALVSLGVAALVAGFVWRSSASLTGGLASSAVLGAVVVGATGFVVGFFGPMIFTPEANQGPLLGLFITGPLGAVVGALGGGALWLAQQSPAGKGSHEGGRRPTTR